MNSCNKVKAEALAGICKARKRGKGDYGRRNRMAIVTKISVWRPVIKVCDWSRGNADLD